MTEGTAPPLNRKVVMLLGNDFLRPYPDPRVYKEARSLLKKGYAVSVVCWHKGGRGLPARETYQGIQVRRVFQPIPRPATPFWWRVPAYKLYVLKSFRLCLKLKPDIVHCHDLDTLAIGVLLKWFAGKPLVYDAHEDFPGMLDGVSKTLARLARRYEKLLIKQADRVIAAEVPYTGIMQRHYGITPAVVMNLPPLENFHPDVDPSRIIQQYNLEGKTVISHIGIIGRDRGIYEMLEALHRLNNGNVRFLLVGRATAGEWERIRQEIKRLDITDNVIMVTDGVDYTEVPQYYKTSDISLALLYPVPNYVVSLPTKLFESIAVGTPVLAGNLDYLSSIVAKYDIGLCADATDPQDIADKLDRLIGDKGMRLRMGRNGLKAAREEFNWGVSEQRLIEVYEGLLNG